MSEENKEAPKEEEKKEENKGVPPSEWYDEKPKTWLITVKLFDKDYKELASTVMKPTEFQGSQKISEVLTPVVSEKASSLKWKQYSAWVGHQPVSDVLEFDDINFLRKPDGSIQVDCMESRPDPEWNPRPVTVKLYEEKTCVVCKAKPADRIIVCLHICLCEDCFPKTERCPICRRNKIH